jgi:hypothetical protein
MVINQIVPSPQRLHRAFSFLPRRRNVTWRLGESALANVPFTRPARPDPPARQERLPTRGFIQPRAIPPSSPDAQRSARRALIANVGGVAPPTFLSEVAYLNVAGTPLRGAPALRSSSIDAFFHYSFQRAVFPRAPVAV